MTPRFTRQGVRDLDGPQRNARAGDRQDWCIHDWGHDDDCPACDDIHLFGYYPRTRHRDRCRKCRETRQY